MSPFDEFRRVQEVFFRGFCLDATYNYALPSLTCSWLSFFKKHVLPILLLRLLGNRDACNLLLISNLLGVFHGRFDWTWKDCQDTWVHTPPFGEKSIGLPHFHMRA